MSEPTLRETGRDDSPGEVGASRAGAPTPAGARVGDRLGRYRLLRVLGEGGMGAVFEAAHDDIGRRVAIKTLRPALAASPQARERFFREARAAARVHHPGVVQVHDVDVEDGTAYLVMDLLEGESLARRLERGPFAPEELLAALGPALDGVASAHEAGVIHRDLKPGNIFLRCAPEGPRGVVVDFGVSRLLDEDSDLTGSGAILGTPAFMSPEQARGAREVDAASDQFSLGAVLYTCLCGRRPFEGQSPLELAWNIQRNRREPLGRRCPSAPRHLVAAIERAMAPEPSARFPSVGALLAALRAPTPRPRRRLALATAALLVLAAGGLARALAPRAEVPSRARMRDPTAATPATPTPAPSAPTPAPPAPQVASALPAPAPTAPHTPTAPAFGRPVLRARLAHAALAPRESAPQAPVAPSPAREPGASPPPAGSAAPVLGRNRAMILGR
ncbi:MAG: serine/threonine protein kinase [Deltaproteobacteria bacterium]|nr:serine/threonine protein kinase [Deltaproteobacteria bacterium]